MDRDIIPSPEVQEQQEEQENAFLSYFMLFVADFCLVSSVCSPGKLAAKGAFYTVLEQLVLRGPDADIDYDSLWSEVEKEARITSVRKSEYMKRDFMKLCKEFCAKVTKSRNKRDQKQKKKPEGNTSKKGQGSQKQKDSGADPEGGSDTGSVPDDMPEGVQRSPDIIKMWKKYRPLTFDEAADFIDDIRENGNFSEFLKQHCELRSIMDRDSIIAPTYEDGSSNDYFTYLWEYHQSNNHDTIISRDEEKLLLFVLCCTGGPFKISFDALEIAKLWKEHGGFRTENGNCLLWHYLEGDFDAEKIMSSSQSRYQYNAETRLWYPIN